MHHIPIWSLIPRDTEARQLAAAPRPIHVLLVEDDQDAAKMTRIALEDSTDQSRLEWVPDLTSAMHRLAKPGVDAIVLDLGLPESTGYLSYHAIEAAMDRQIPVVILTSDDRSDIRDLTMASGAYSYLNALGLSHWTVPAGVTPEIA